MRAEPPNLTTLWRLLANFQVSISANFARWLAVVTARVEDDRIRSVLAEQLSDELGHGNFEASHQRMFSKMMAQLAPWRPSAELDDVLLAPGRSAVARLDRIYGSTDPFVGVGAVIAGEVVAAQLDSFLGDEFRRQEQLAASSIEWLTVHEHLEVEHARDATMLVEWIPDQFHPSAARGAVELHRAGWSFLDEVGGGGA